MCYRTNVLQDLSGVLFFWSRMTGCPPARQKVGRQNKIKQENVRKPTKKPADKTRENRKMSAAKANKAENS